MDFNNVTNQLQYWNSAAWIPITNAASGTGWALSGNHIYSSNTGFVGIGTTTPLHKLSVVTPSNFYGLTHSNGNITMGSWLTATTAQFGTKSNHPLEFFTNNGSAQMTILPNGNVGIGTTTPTAKLEIVESGIGPSGLLVKNTTSFSTIDIDAVNGDAALRFFHNGAYKWNVRNSPQDNFQIFDSGGASSKFMIENGTGKIGFRTANPQSDLHINPIGAGNILIGTDKNTGGFTNLEMGISEQSNGYSYIQSTKASGTSYGTLQLNPSGGDVTVAGYVGIGTNTPFSPLDIQQPGGNNAAFRILSSGHTWGFQGLNNFVFLHNGQNIAAIDGDDGDYISYSDKRLKKNIQEFSPVLDKVLKLKAKKYHFIGSEDSSKNSMGFISQEVFELFPELVNFSKRSAEDSTMYLGLKYKGFSIIAIKAIQEQQVIIDDLKEEMEKLKVIIAVIQQKVK